MSVRLRRTSAGLAVALCLALTSCEAVPEGDSSADSAPAATVAPTPVRLTTSVADPAAAPIDRPVHVRAQGAALHDVRVTSATGTLEGAMAHGSWRSTGRLEPGTDYVVEATAERADGSPVVRRTRFHTVDLSLSEQTYPSIAPLAGETVGVGMPVIVTYDLPVSDRAAFERHMSVTSTPAQPGAWHWLSDHEVHWRPKSYWQPGTDVRVDLDVNSIPAGNGIYGQQSRVIDFHVGAANIYRVDAQAHHMQVFSNGALLRTLPVTTGKPGFTTRSGTKVIIEKFAEKRMNSETVGISRDDPEAYDIDDVRWAMRVTYSGEFIHAAPWSVGSQGYANVSHGCTGLSTEDAGWLYSISKRGDVVEYSGTDRGMTLTNGYGDWNASFAEYRRGSALS